MLKANVHQSHADNVQYELKTHHQYFSSFVFELLPSLAAGVCACLMLVLCAVGVGVAELVSQGPRTGREVHH